MRRLTDHDRQIRRDLATATVGLLIALAFGAMVDAVKEPLRAISQPHHSPGTLRDTCLMALIFLSAGFSFFLGTQMYLGDPITQAQSRFRWRWDFFSTVLTLTLLVLLGSYTNPTFRSAFEVVLACLFGFQLIWALPHIAWKSVRLGWLMTNLLVCAAALASLSFFHGTVGLSILGVVSLAKLIYDMIYIQV